MINDCGYCGKPVQATRPRDKFCQRTKCVEARKEYRDAGEWFEVKRKNRFLLAPVLVSLLSGCTTYAGVGIHAHRFDSPEFTADNPVGVIGGELTLSERISLRLEHHSSIPTVEQGVGYNVGLLTIKHDWTK